MEGAALAAPLAPATGDAEPLLRIRDVAVRFRLKRGELTALERVSLDVARGEFAVIVGPSGCGKSTLLRMVAGLQPITEGSVTLEGRPILGPSAERGMVFQSYTLYQWLTVLRNVQLGPSFRGVPARESRETARRLLRQVGLEGFEDAWPKQLSGGMQQRVALARALANDPKILLMDEPFGALDSQTRALMQELLLRIWEEAHKTVLFITHDVEEAILLADRIFVLTARPGRIKAELRVDLPRPRALETTTTPEFMRLKRELLGLVHDEAVRAETGLGAGARGG